MSQERKEWEKWVRDRYPIYRDGRRFSDELERKWNKKWEKIVEDVKEARAELNRMKK